MLSFAAVRCYLCVVCAVGVVWYRFVAVYRCGCSLSMIAVCVLFVVVWLGLLLVCVV